MRDFHAIHCVQRSEDWFTARLGRLTGSCAADAMSRGTTRSKEADPRGEPEAAARRELRTRLALEQMTRRCLDKGDCQTKAMRQGLEREPMARAEFEVKFRVPVFECGFLAHTSRMSGASLDGYLGDFDEVLSIKCREWAEHAKAVKGGDVPRDAMQQLLHELSLTGAKVAHYLNYNPDFPPHLRLHVKTFKARDLMVELSDYKKAHDLFLEDIDHEISALGAITL